MSKIIYNKSIIPTFEDNNVFAASKKYYFTIPVRMIEVIVKYTQPLELDHFERLILSLYKYKVYTIDELVDITLLDKLLIKFIINKLQEEGYLDKRYRVTTKGDETLMNLYRNIVCKVGYLFYDINRGCLFNNICSDDDFVIDNSSFEFYKCENDILDSSINFSEIPILKNDVYGIDFNKEIGMLMTKQDKEVLSIEIVNQSKTVYKLLSCVSKPNIGKDYNGEYEILNPFTLENDESLYLFLNKSIGGDVVNKLVLDLFSNNDIINDDVIIKANYDKAFNHYVESFFTTKIKDSDLGYVPKLMKIMKGYNPSIQLNFSDAILAKSNMKEAIINLSDLFENVLYDIAVKDIHIREYIQKIDKKSVSSTLEIFTKSIGFNFNENTNKIFCIYKNNLMNILASPSKKNLQECVTLNIICANFNNNHCFHELAKIYPDLLNILYEFKSEIRDKKRHSNDLNNVEISHIYNLLFELFDYGLNYKINKQFSKENNYIETSKDKQYKAKEFIRMNLNKGYFTTNSKFALQTQYAFINMYENFYTNNINYSSHAYSLMDELLKQICMKVNKKFKLKHNKLDEYFTNKDDILKFLSTNKFQISHEAIQIDIRNMFVLNFNFELDGALNFRQSVLSKELAYLVCIMKENPKLINNFNNISNLFIVTTIISNINKHQQAEEFEYDIASYLVDSILKIFNVVSPIL